MAELVKVNKKVINDPLYTSVALFLKDRLAKLEQDDPNNELPVALERYTGIVSGDLVIENPLIFRDGISRVCFVSRKTGFARVDVEFKQVEMKAILDDFAIPITIINDVDHLKSFVKDAEEPIESLLVWLEYKQTYGVILTQDKATSFHGPMEAFGDLFFQEYTMNRESLTYVDPDTLESGTVEITDASIGQKTYPLFIYELLVQEANIPVITSNLPDSITTQRAQTFNIPNTYWFGGTLDITTTATVELSTASGFTIPKRSDDLLSIDGETIYGSASKEVEDSILVRVSYPYGSRIVRKTFVIKVVIEKDTQTDLVIESTPEQAEVTTGDTIEAQVFAYFKGQPVEIIIPPATLRSGRGNGGVLTYVRSIPATKAMIYRGTVNTVIPGGQEQQADSFSGEFQYNDGVTPYKIMGYVNVLVMKPETRPVFTLTTFDSNIEGYKGDTGVLKVEAKYGDDVVPNTDLGFPTGMMGTKNLVRYDSIDEEGIHYTILRDSEIPGTPITDAFNTNVAWTDRYGVYHSDGKVINVKVKLKSIIEVVPAGEQPRHVKRFQTGGPTFNLMVNGTASNGLIRTLKVDDVADPTKQYITNQKDVPNRWMVMLADATEKTYDVNFTFTATVDNETQTYHFKQTFIIAKYPPDKDNPGPETPVDDSDPSNPGGGPAPGETGTGPGGPDPIDNIDGPGEGEGPFNANITVVPTSFTIGGISDKAYKMTFKVFEGVNDITSTSKVLTESTVEPPNVTFNSITYDAANNCFVLNYYKNKGVTEGNGAIFVCKQSAVDPIDKKDIGRCWFNLNVTQTKILKVVDAPERANLTPESPTDIPFGLEFSGVAIKANDPGLAWESLNITDTEFTSINEDSVTVIDNVWRYVGRAFSETRTFRLTYTDTDGKKYTANISFPITITFPPAELVIEQDVFETKIWETGKLPATVKAGTKSFPTAITSTTVVLVNKYISLSGLNWEVKSAEKTASTTNLGVRFNITIGQSAVVLTHDFTFNLEAWDGITFAATLLSDPTITGASGDTGNVLLTLIYKGKDATATAEWVKASSTIPETFTVTDSGVVDGKRTLAYQTQLGGVHDLVLTFKAPGGSETTKVTIPTDITWPHDLNILSSGDTVRGYYGDVVKWPLSMNFAGTPVTVDDPNVEITLVVVDDAASINSVVPTGVNVSLDKSADKNTTIEYAATFSVTYTDEDGTDWTKTFDVPVTIRVSDVVIGNTGATTANVYARGPITTTLVDERGQKVPITSYMPDGQSLVTLDPYENGWWYVMQGSTSAPINLTFPLILGYSYGGKDYTLKYAIPFTINKWDGKNFTIDTQPTQLTGDAGRGGSFVLNPLKVGYPAAVVVDTTQSVIPPNFALGDMTADGQLPYTFVGNGVDTVKVVVVLADAVAPFVEGQNQATFSVRVTSRSSDEEFTVVSYDDTVAMDWSKTANINVKLKYGAYDLPANAGGLSFTLNENAPKGISIVSRTKDGLVLKGIRSDVENAVTDYDEIIDVSYAVGAPEPKKATLNVKATVSMGPATINRNEPVSQNVWNIGTLPQNVMFNGAVLSTVDHFELRTDSNPYFEFTDNPPVRRYEVIGAEKTAGSQFIPLRIFYKVDAVETLQTLDFDFELKLPAYNGTRFKVTPTPDNIGAATDQEVDITFAVLYKDKSNTTSEFKQALSTIPPQVEITNVLRRGSTIVVTFKGKLAGLAEANLVFWDPDAVAATGEPLARDVTTVKLPITVMDETGLEVGRRDNLMTAKSGDTGTYDMQLLFGGIPLDIPAELASGKLIATVEKGATSSLNANVLSITQWGKESFDYALAGPVIPGSTVAVSDYLNLTYVFGGQNYTRRVEIPMSYTSSAPVVTFTNLPAVVKMFAKGSLTAKIMADGVDISTGWASIANVDEDQYIAYAAKTYEVIDAELTAITHTVLSRITGTYRSWQYATNVNIDWSIDAWNQITWEPSTSISTASMYEDASGSFTLSCRYRNDYYNVNLPPYVGMIDYALSDLKGLVSITYNRSQGTITNSVQFYDIKGLNAGKDTIRIAWRRKDATGNVEGVDYSYTTMDVEITADSLTIAGPSNLVTGGSGDTITGAALVVRRRSNNSQIVNTNTNLIIKPVDETIFKITALAASAMTLLVTAPYTMADGPVTVPMTVEYTDTVLNRKLVGIINYPITLKRPADWPVVTATGQAVRLLYSYGPSPFTVKVGTTDVTSQVTPISMTDPDNGFDDKNGYMELSVDQPVAGTWWWITSTAVSSSDQTRTTKWKLKVPYRGDFVSVDADWKYILRGSGSTPQTPFVVTAPSGKFLMRNVGDQSEIPFDIKWRAYKYGKAVFKPELSGAAGATNFADYFKVVGQRYDDTTGLTYLKIEMIQYYNGTMTFFFDMENVTNPVVGTNRGSGSVGFYDLTITQTGGTANNWTMWQSKRMNTLLSIKDGTTELMTASQVTAIDYPHFVTTTTGNNPNIQFQSDTALPGESRNVTYSIQLPAAYSSQIIKITIPAILADYDGNELTYNFNSLPSWPSAAIGASKLQAVYVGIAYRGSSVAGPSINTNFQAVTQDIRDENNNQGLTFNGMNYVTPSNWSYVSFGSTLQFVGTLKIPLRYIGTGSGNYPLKTPGKNYVIIELENVVFYENKLYLLPPDTDLAEITANDKGILPAPLAMTVGKGLDVNKVLPTATGMAWNIVGTTMNGVVSKPTTNFSSATGINLSIDYDNRGDDVEVTVPLRFNFNTTYRSAAINSDLYFNQKVLIKGKQVGDEIVITPNTFTNMLVWNVSGPAFTIVQNGTTITAAMIKSIAIEDNPYIRIPETSPNTSTRWFEIYNGKTDGPTDTVAKFTVVYNDGIKDVTVKQDIPINIRQYSGSPWSVVPVALVAVASAANVYCDGLVGSTGGSASGYLQAKYKNVTVDTNNASQYAIYARGVNLPNFNGVRNQRVWQVTAGNSHTYEFLFTFDSTPGSVDSVTPQMGEIIFGLAAKENDPTAVEGMDYIRVPIPCLTYTANKWYVTEGPTEYTGKFGDANAKLPFRIRLANVYQSLIQNGQTNLINPGNLVTVTGQSDQATLTTVKFNADLLSAPKDVRDVTFVFGATTNALAARAVVKVTQVSTADFPTVTNVRSVNGKMLDTGTLPFTIMDSDGVTDVTSQATLTSINANDYVDVDSGKWRIYNAATGETSIRVTMNFSILYHGKTLTLNQDVDFVIAGYTASPTVSGVKTPSAKVWDKGTELPFTISVNGTPIPAAWVTGITATSTNGFTKAGPTGTDYWKVIAGDQTKAVTDVLSYAVTVNNGKRSWIVNQVVNFNIAQYDGIEFKLNVMNTQAGNTELQALFLGTGSSGTNGAFYQGIYQGDVVTAPVGVSGSGAGITVGNGPLNNVGNVAWALRQTTAPNGTVGKSTFNARIKRASSAGTVENVDVATLVTPVYFVSAVGNMFTHTGTTTSISGDQRDQPSLVLNMFKYTAPTTTKLTDLTVGSTAITFAPTGVIELVPGSIIKNGFKVKFLTNVAQATTTTVKATAVTADGTVSWDITVNQTPKPDYPDATVTTQNASANQSGGIPFTLTDTQTGEDVTQNATVTAIAANPYVNLISGKWYVYNDVTVDTPVTVKFTYSILYHGTTQVIDQDVPFVIKPATAPAVSDVTAQSGNVWDKGAAGLPFTMKVSGNPVPSAWIKSITATSPNNRVTVGSDGAWKIVAGDQTQAVVENVTYSVTIDTGSHQWTVTQAVDFNIAKYDGIEFKLKVIGLSATGDIVVPVRVDGFNTTPAVPSTAAWYVRGTYRGDDILSNPGFTINSSSLIKGINIDSVGAVSYNGQDKRFNANVTTTAAVNAQNVVRFTRSGATGTAPGVDYVDLVIPITSFVANTINVDQTPSITGKFGDTMDVKGDLRYKGATKLDLNGTGVTVALTGSPAITIVPGSITADGFKVQFKDDVSVDTTTSATVSYKYVVSGSTLTVNKVLSVIQKPGQDDVAATGSMEPIVVGESGQIVLTGTVGDKVLAGNVQFKPEDSDAKGLVTFGDPTDGEDGTIVIPVTGVKVGEENLSIRIVVNGASGNTPGKDYLDITVAAVVNYATLDKGDSFAETVTGDSSQTVTVTQWVYGPGESTPLEKSEGFQTSGTGDANTPMTLNQSVTYPTE